MKKVNLIIYGVLGTGMILYGVSHLLFPAVFVSEAARSFPLAHIVREQAAGVSFIGLMAFWCIFNYERRAVVHYFLILFTFLIAAIHWFDYLSGHLSWMSPLYNTVPLLVLVLMAIWSRPMARA